MEVLGARRHRLEDIKYQCSLLRKLNDNDYSITFNDASAIPSIEAMDHLMKYLDLAIESDHLYTSDKLIVLELQLLFTASIIGGIYPSKLTRLNLNSVYIGNLLDEFKYVNDLVSKIRAINDDGSQEEIFTVLKKSLIFDSINLFLVLNGLETTLTENKFRVLHGRYHYMLHGNLSSVRDELCKRFNAENHIDLLVKLGLMDRYHAR